MAKIFSLFGEIFIDNKEANKSVEKTTTKAKEAEGGFGKMIGAAGKIGAAVVAGATAAAAGIGAMVGKISETTGSIQDAADRTGASAEEIQKWSYAAKLSGLSAEQMEKAMIKQQKAFTDASTGSKTMSEAYAKLGVDITKVGSSSEAFNAVIDKLANMTDETQRNALANDIFGKSYADLAPLLNSGSDGIAKLKQEASDLGMVMSNETVAGGAEMGDVLDKLKGAAEGIFNSIGAQLIPVVTQLANQILANMPQIQAMFAQIGPALASFFAQIMPMLMQLVQSLLPVVLQIIQAILPIILQLMPSIVQLVQQLLPVIVQVIQALIPMIMQLLPFVVQIVQLLLPPMLQVIQALLPIIIMMLPYIVQIISAILPVLIQLLQTLLPPLMSLLNTVIPPLTSVIKILAKAIGTTLNNVIANITPIIDGMTTAFAGVINFINNIFKGDWESAWQDVQDIFGGIFDGLKGLVKAPLTYIIDQINSVFASIGRIEIPDWVPGIGGQGFEFPQIPRLAVGLDYVPYDEFPALLHRGERVMTARENAAYSNGAGIDYDRLAAAIAKAMGGVTMAIDGRKFGRLVSEYV